jgi:hypothetical protein
MNIDALLLQEVKGSAGWYCSVRIGAIVTKIYFEADLS